jgi:hypothetical protein
MTEDYNEWACQDHITPPATSCGPSDGVSGPFKSGMAIEKSPAKRGRHAQARLNSESRTVGPIRGFKY